MKEMSNEEKKLELLKPDNFSAKDPKNPKNIDAEEMLERARKKRAEILSKKSVIINGKKEK